MAWTRQSKTTGLYGGVYRDAAGQVRYLPIQYRTKTEARNAAGAEEEKARRGQRSDPTAARMRWSAWADEWYPNRSVEASTAASSESKMNRCRKRWGATPLGKISRHDLQVWVYQLEREPLAASTVRQTFYLVRKSLDAAIEHGYLDVNPAAGVKLPTLPPALERYLDDDEVDALLYHLDERWRLLAELLLDSGMRISEACGLHWERVNLDAGTVTVVETWDIERRAMKAYPKGRRVRTVPLTGAMVDRLVEWRRGRADTGSCGRPHVADSARAARARARGRVAPTSCRSSLVIPGPKDAPVDPHNFAARQWALAVELAGIAHATPHALRHTYASRLLTAGVPIARVSKMLGHASIATTERYAHLQTDGHDEVRAALEGRVARDASRDADTPHPVAADRARRSPLRAV